MDTSFFYDLYNIIYIPAAFELEETEFFLFLLGGYLETDLYEYEKIKAIFENYKSESYIPLRSLLERKYSKSLAFHKEKKFTLDDLINIHFEKNTPQFIKIKEDILNKEDEIDNLYKKFHISIPKENAELLLLRLFSVCFTGQIPRLFASYKNQKLKPTTIEATLGRNDDGNELYKMLEQHNKVIVSGEHGMGKTHFIKYCLSTWEKDDYCYICYEINRDNTLRKIRYAGINGYEYSNASDSSLFNKQFPSSLLVIDNMPYSETFFDDLGYLAGMQIKIIIVTTASIPDNSFHGFWYYKLPSLPDNILYKIFEYNSELSLENTNLKMTLSCYTQNNPLLVSLIAFQCKKLYNTSAHQNNNSIIETVLSKLEYLNKHIDFASSNKKTFKHQHDQKTLDLLGHIKYVYDIIWNSSKENESFQEFMKQLCLFGWSPIPTKFIEQILPSYDSKILMELAKMGLITVVGEYIQISSLISHAFFAAESLSPIEYKEIVFNLSKFLREYDQTLDIPYLSDALFIFFMSLYNDIPAQNNPSQSTTADYFEDWQQLGYLIIEYYNHNSSCDLAQKLTKLIKYPEHLKNGHNALDKLLIDFSNKIQIESETDNMCSYIDSLIHIFDNFSKTNKQLRSSNLYYSSNINMTAFVLNALDTTLNQLFVLLIEQPINPYNDFSIYTRILVFDRLLRIIDSYRYHISIPLSKEQSCFYYGCCWLMMQNNISKDELEEILRIIDAWNNINYRIRGLAFIIFWASNLAYDNQYKDLFTDLIKPNMEKLGHLIQNCKLIPEQTFRLCFYAYIKAATVQYVFMQKDDLSEIESPNILNREILHFLFSRCNLTKKDYDELIKCVDSVFPDCINL